MERIKGTVSWFNNAKGFGFLSRPAGGDVFVHHSAIQADGYRTLNNGDDVEFEVSADPKGRVIAVNVVRLPAPTEPGLRTSEERVA